MTTYQKPFTGISPTVFIGHPGCPADGAWLNLDGDVCEIDAKIDSIKAGFGSPADEYVIVDWENCGDLPDWYSLAEIAEAYSAMSENWQAFCEYSGYRCGDAPIETMIEEFENHYMGQFDNETDFAENLADSCGMLDEMPEWARPYFDYEAWGRDLFLSGDYFMTKNGYVFRSLY